MANTQPNYWDVDGVSLHTYAYSIESLGGTRESPPEPKGENLDAPLRYGKIFAPKQPDSRTITLGMWVLGADENGNPPPEGTSLRVQYDYNLRKLRNLLFNYDRQMTLTKRFYDNFGNLVTASALVEYAGGFEPEMQGPYRSTFTVDLLLADPFFYGVEETFSVTPNVPVGITIKGDYPTTRVTITFPDNVYQPRLGYGTQYVELNGLTVGGGYNAIVDVAAFNAYLLELAPQTATIVTNRVRRKNPSYWLPLDNKLNTYNYTRVNGQAAPCTVKYQPAYL